MLNPYLPKFAKIVAIAKASADAKLFTLSFVDKNDRADFKFCHGQFLMLGVLGFGEAAFDICSLTNQLSTFELAVRKVGKLTEKLHQLKIGDLVTIRGPFGNGFLEKSYQGKDLLLIGGGCGFITMRSLILDYLAKKLPVKKLDVFYGCLNEDTLFFKNEFSRWRQKINLAIALEKPDKKWAGPKGVITILFNGRQDFGDTAALIVGPPVMYKFVIKELKKGGMRDGDIYVSLERRMYCGIGVCQHCAIGPYYVCKDGPVFSWEQLKNIPGAI
ncbi:MAG: FAD/NAD(P)-binding protein [Patescibacteria group bacterium]|jgi:NAD(P)H-flavin reductase